MLFGYGDCLMGPLVRIVAVGGLLMVAGCSAGTPTRDTMHRAEDLQSAGVSLREQLANSSWLAGRTASSPEIALLPDELTNRSNDRISDGAAWPAVARVLFDPGMQAFLRSRNVNVYMPPERVPLIRAAGLDVPEGVSGSATHFMRGVFRSATRVAAVSGAGPSDLRTDTFMLDLTVIERDSGRAVWTGTHEFKRYAKGTLAD